MRTCNASPPEDTIHEDVLEAADEKTCASEAFVLIFLEGESHIDWGTRQETLHIRDSVSRELYHMHCGRSNTCRSLDVCNTQRFRGPSACPCVPPDHIDGHMQQAHTRTSPWSRGHGWEAHAVLPPSCTPAAGGSNAPAGCGPNVRRTCPQLLQCLDSDTLGSRRLLLFSLYNSIRNKDDFHNIASGKDASVARNTRGSSSPARVNPQMVFLAREIYPSRFRGRQYGGKLDTPSCIKLPNTSIKQSSGWTPNLLPRPHK